MVNKDEVINNAISTYFKKSKQIDIDAMTGHLDRMKDKEIEIMLKQLFSEVFEKGKEFGTVFDR